MTYTHQTSGRDSEKRKISRYVPVALRTAPDFPSSISSQRNFDEPTKKEPSANNNTNRIEQIKHTSHRDTLNTKSACRLVYWEKRPGQQRLPQPRPLRPPPPCQSSTSDIGMPTHVEGSMNWKNDIKLRNIPTTKCRQTPRPRRLAVAAQYLSTKLPRRHQFENDVVGPRITRGGQAQDRNGRQERTATSDTIAVHQSLTGSCTSCPSCCGCCETGGQHGWRAQTPHGHPRSSWPSTPGTCRHQSSCGSPHPLQGTRAFGWSCAAPRWSSGRIADPSCSQPG
jgi:hypothetical protein